MKITRIFAALWCLSPSLFAEIFEMRNGERHSLVNVAVANGVVRGNTAEKSEMHLKVSDVARVLSFRPKGLIQAETLLRDGNPQEALSLVEALLASEAAWKGIPGSWWSEITELRLEVLALLGDANKLELAIGDWEKSRVGEAGGIFPDFWKMRLAAIKGDQSEAAIVGAKLLASGEPALDKSLVERILAENALRGQRFEEAAAGFRRILVMTGKARHQHAAAELGLVRCLLKLGRSSEALAVWQRLRSEHSEFALKNEANPELLPLFERFPKPKNIPVLRLPPW